MPTLNWIGKEAVITHHQQVPFRLLKDVPDLACGEAGSGNLIVQGDILFDATLTNTTGNVVDDYRIRMQATPATPLGSG